jgi:serine/threonine protein kinase
MSFKKINGYIIHLKEVLGKGSYGEVFKGEQEFTKRVCAIKVLTKKLSSPSTT